MKEFGEDHGVIYVAEPEDALRKAIELVEKGCIEVGGIKARKFVENYSWDNITKDFEAVLRAAIRGE